MMPSARRAFLIVANAICSAAFCASARLSSDAIGREIKGIDGGCGFLFHFLKIDKSMFQEVGFTDFFKLPT
jgi:hypothetical protein